MGHRPCYIVSVICCVFCIEYPTASIISQQPSHQSIAHSSRAASLCECECMCIESVLSISTKFNHFKTEGLVCVPSR